MLSIKNWEENTYYLGMYLKTDNVHQFRFDFFQLHTNNQIEFFDTLSDAQRKPFYSVVKPNEFGAIFSKLEPSRQLAIIEELEESYATAMMKNLPTDEETNEDFGEMAAVKGAVDLDISALRATRVRLLWLLALLLIGLFQATIITNSHHLLKEMALISIFIPLIVGVAGNTGTQPLAIVLRGLAEEKLNKRSFRRLLKRGAMTALLMTIVCGLLAGLIGWFLAELYAVMRFIVGISMFLSIFICTLTGTLIPYTIYKLKIDLAVASDPFITTINDIVAVGVYFSVASILFFYM